MTNPNEKSEIWKSIIEKTSQGKDLLTYGNFATDGEEASSVFKRIHLEGTDSFWTFNHVHQEFPLL